MKGVTSYILSVTAAAVVAAVLLTLSGKGTAEKLIRMLAGIFMTLAVVSPLLKLELPDPRQWLMPYAEDGQAAAAEGEKMAEDAAHTFIKERVESYILDKAARCGASLTVEVELDSEGVPVGAALTGAVPPDTKTRLIRILRADLGLGEEALRWYS